MLFFTLDFFFIFISINSVFFFGGGGIWTQTIVGRRWGVIASCGIFSIGVALQTASSSIPIFAVGRVFAGMGVGLTSCLVPMYQSECAPFVRFSLSNQFFSFFLSDYKQNQKKTFSSSFFFLDRRKWIRGAVVACYVSFSWPSSTYRCVDRGLTLFGFKSVFFSNGPSPSVY